MEATMAPLPHNIYYLLEQHVANLTENDTLYHDLLPTMTPGCIRYAIVMNCFLIGFLCTVGTAGNLVSFAVFSKDRVKTSTSFLLQALAVVDSCFLIVVFPTYTVSALLSHYSNSIEEDDVKIYLIPIAYVLQTATIWLVVLVGWNRYIAVCQPFKAAKLCTVARAKKQLAIVLSLAIIYSFPKFIEIPTDLVENNTYSIIYNNIMYPIFMLTAPLISLLWINTQLIRALRKLRRKRAEIRNRQSTRQQQDNSVTLVLIVVVVILIVCQTPALINHILWTLLSEEQRYCGRFQYYFQRASNVCVVMNSAINFLVYLLLNRRFRRIFFQYFCCCSTAADNSNGVGADATVLAPLDKVTSYNNQNNRPCEGLSAIDGTASNPAAARETVPLKAIPAVETSGDKQQAADARLKLNPISEATENEASTTAERQSGILEAEKSDHSKGQEVNEDNMESRATIANTTTTRSDFLNDSSKSSKHPLVETSSENKMAAAGSDKTSTTNDKFPDSPSEIEQDFNDSENCALIK